MYIHVPFEKSFTGNFNLDTIAEASPGHVLAVNFRIYGGTSGEHPYWCKVTISDIGASKVYLLNNVVTSIYTSSNQGFALTSWMKLGTIYIDHTIEPNHKLLFEASASASTSLIKGFFTYLI